MFKINENYLKLPGSYLFSDIGKKVAAYTEAHPEKEIIRLGIGDVTLPLAPAVIERLHSAVDEMAKAETFKGYAARFQQTRFLSVMVQKAIPAILLIFLPMIQGLRYVILSIPFMWILMQCLDGLEPIIQKRKNGTG